MTPDDQRPSPRPVLATGLRIAVMRLRRRLTLEREPGNPLSTSAMAVLGALQRQGDLTIGELAAHERVQPPSMTRTVNCLEQDGYVARRPHQVDRRQVLVGLTDLGRETLMADRRRRDEWLSRRLRALTPAERATLRAAVPILDRLAQED